MWQGDIDFAEERAVQMVEEKQRIVEERRLAEEEAFAAELEER
jgi:phage terminase Nu1 subunit (DNA packaging protein)